MTGRIGRVLAVLAAACLLLAGCGGGGPTPVPTPSPSPTPIRDPNELIARSLYQLLRVESFHVRADIQGRASLSILGGGGSILGALGASIDLGGSWVEGDVDVAGRAADLSFEVPGFPMGLNGRVIVIGGVAYTRLSIQGDKYSRSDAGAGLAGLGTPAPSGSAAATQADELRRNLLAAGLTATMEPPELLDGRTCYRVSIRLPLDRVNAMLSAAGGYAARLTVESAAVDYWVYEDTLLPARAELTADAGSMGNLQAQLNFSRYGAAVTVEAPDPSQVS